MKFEAVVILSICLGAIYGIARWLMAGKPAVEPWGAEIEAAIHQPEALFVCHRCLAPQEHEGWFCPECGAAVGQYNNYLPFVYVFSEGEVFRAGVAAPLRPSFLIVTGYLLLSASAYA